MIKTSDISIALFTVDDKEKAVLDFSSINITKNSTIYLSASNGEVFLIVPSNISNSFFIDWIVSTYNVQDDINAEASRDGDTLILIGDNLNLEIDMGKEL